MIRYISAIICMMMLGFNANATVITSQMTGIEILGSTYDVTFSQDDAGTSANSFNSINPTLTFFSQSDALSAVNAILAAVTDPIATFCPGSVCGDNNYWGFRVPYIVTDSSYTYVTGWSNNGNPAPSGPYTVSRTNGNYFSFATFQASDVPEPSTIALMGIALLGFGFRRRKQEGC